MYDTIKAKTQFYFERNLMVHVKVNSGSFYNGFIVEISSDFFMINDRRLGHMPVFFMEVKDIEKYEVRE